MELAKTYEIDIRGLIPKNIRKRKDNKDILCFLGMVSTPASGWEVEYDYGLYSAKVNDDGDPVTLIGINILGREEGVDKEWLLSILKILKDAGCEINQFRMRDYYYDRRPAGEWIDLLEEG